VISDGSKMQKVSMNVNLTMTLIYCNLGSKLSIIFAGLPSAFKGRH
jgi:hypothetical protein